MSNYLLDGYHREPAAYAPVDERVSFIRRTYLHLAVSVAALVGLEVLLFKTGIAKDVLQQMFAHPASILVVMALFICGGFLAQYMARSSMPTPVKYLGLAGYICLEAVFLLPILYYAQARLQTELITQAALITLVTFGGLSLTVFISKKDFSFLGYGLAVFGWGMLGIIVAAIVSPMIGGPAFGLGIWFSFLGIALAAGYIIYDTSNVLHHYRTDEHVGAALELLADVVLMFYYILRLLLQSRD